VTDADLVPSTDADGPLSVAAVLDTITRELVALLGDEVAIDAVRTDVDVFEGREPLVTGLWLDSMDLVQVIAALEARFGVNLAALLTGDEPTTLRTIAERIARSGP
jgi:acyl carrier protein